MLPNFVQEKIQQFTQQKEVKEKDKKSKNANKASNQYAQYLKEQPTSSGDTLPKLK